MTDRLIDFHCHLDLYPDFEGLVADCERRGIYTLAVTTTPRAWSRNRDVCGITRHVRAGLGLHPQLVGEHWREIDLWERYSHETRYVGEVGIDAGPAHFRSLERQMAVFRQILIACSSQGGKILSVHSVRSATKVLDLLEEHLPEDRGSAVLHWFTGSMAEARRAVALGCYFSINRQMLTSDRGMRLVRSLPVERLLLETDGPFTSEDGQPTRPQAVSRTLSDLASAFGQTRDDLRRQLLGNLRTLTEVADPRPSANH
ncbi:TatD family deoxyribonuclease [Methylobacterium terricola]|uniref:TatD family deoxyribonuclease n=1 Tax=Methylobacterium terricola TaxID=2583531 RepID=A0A5C4L9I3_9HYPH|nr:Qat anti-phage system TatD family nuclease QatD [Methylobacterium terricola]TNC09189.1 TatD family deoxyribonuclease [Methylobacterium terricola]